ncbi:MAG: hypothetical protein KGL39_35755 [Patescibacteria group bacterium]|nr:hypothetical protein [Patescibacteria group bacterium]
MTLAIQFVDRNGGTPGTALARVNLNPLVVADSHIKSPNTGPVTSFTGAVVTIPALDVVINPGNGNPAQEVTYNGGTYTITGGTNTDNYVFLNTSGAFSQTAVTRGAAAPATPANSICLFFATIGGTSGTIVSTFNVAPVDSQLLATSVSAHAPATFPGFTWDDTKSVGDQLDAISSELATHASEIATNISNISTLQGEIPTPGAELTTTDVKITGLTGAQNTFRIAGATSGGPPTTGTWQLHDLVTDLVNKAWYVCVTAGSPGTWQPFNGLVGQLLTSGTAPSAAPSSGTPFSGIGVAGNSICGTVTYVASGTALTAGTVYPVARVTLPQPFVGTPAIVLTPVWTAAPAHAAGIVTIGSNYFDVVVAFLLSGSYSYGGGIVYHILNR